MKFKVPTIQEMRKVMELRKYSITLWESLSERQKGNILEYLED